MTSYREDVATLRKPVRLPDGRLRVEAHIARTGILEYLEPGGKVRREYRPPSAVFDPASLAQYAGLIVTDGHPNDPTRVIHLGNVATFRKGHVGDDIRRDGDHIAAALYIDDARLIDEILTRKKRQISVGYRIKARDEAGYTPDGERYDVLQERIMPNHVAVCVQGRAATAEIRLDEGDDIAFLRTDAELTAKSREKLSDADFAVPGKRKLPIYDATHLRAAMARFNQTVFEDSEEKRRAFNRIMAQAKKLDVDASGFEDRWQSRLDHHHNNPGADMKDLESLSQTLADALAKNKQLEQSLEETRIRADAAEGRVSGLEASIAELTAKSISPDTITKLEIERDDLKLRADEAEKMVAAFPATLDAAVKERIRIISGAASVIGEKDEKGEARRFDEISNTEIMRMTLHAATGSDANGKSDEWLMGRFDALVESTSAGMSALERLRKQTLMNNRKAEDERTRLDEAISKKKSTPSEKWREPLPSSRL